MNRIDNFSIVIYQIRMSYLKIQTLGILIAEVKLV